MAKARIYRKGMRATQSGSARASQWILEHEPIEGKRPDPLMGWAGSGDTEQQLRLVFPTLEAAKGYAARNGIDVEVGLPENRPLILRSYADNFL